MTSPVGIMNVIQLSEGAPAPAGVYVHVAELADWIERAGYPQLADEIKRAARRDGRSIAGQVAAKLADGLIVKTRLPMREVVALHYLIRAYLEGGSKCL